MSLLLNSLVETLITSVHESIKHVPRDIARPETKTDEKYVPNETYPSWMRPIFAITIREHRFQSLLERLGPVWQTYVVKWNGTIGVNIDRQNWLLKQKIRKYCQLTPGQLGCYDSHVGIWKNCVRSQINTFVVEDDVNLRHDDPAILSLLNLFWARLEDSKQEYDLLYVGHNNKYKPSKYLTNFLFGPNIVVPRGCQGLFAYVITPKGAQFLLDHATPYEKPVDVFVQHQFEYYNKENKFRCLAIYPSPFYVVECKSDTAK